MEENSRKVKGNILEYLEQTEERFRYKMAVDDGHLALTWHELLLMAKQIGSGLGRRVSPGNPIPVLMEKSSVTLAVMLGVVYAGCFYVPVNPANPLDRMEKIIRTLEAPVVVTDTAGRAILDQVERHGLVVTAEELLREEIDEEALLEIRGMGKETDLLYALFTSGSTGMPKAVAVSHDAVIRFLGHFTEIFEITEADRIGNQAPFDFDVSVKDIYSAVMTGASLILIPREYFSTPPRLLDHLCEQKVTTLIWAVSALGLVSALRGLEYRIPERVDKVLFSGEAMPPMHLRKWQEALKNARFVNLYGPTEITCNCTYYPVSRQFSDGEKIPIGRAFPGRRVFLVDESGQEILTAGEHGEIWVSGESVSQGYYHDQEQTEKRFVLYQNGDEKEWTYKTGDIGFYDEEGELVFAGRRDFQIKHMGHRIELEEIEAAMNRVEGVMGSCCVFDEERNRIVGFYMGDAIPGEVRARMKEKVPVYMVPSRIRKTAFIPLNKNGKTDRGYFQRKGAEMP